MSDEITRLLNHADPDCARMGRMGMTAWNEDRIFGYNEYNYGWSHDYNNWLPITGSWHQGSGSIYIFTTNRTREEQRRTLRHELGHMHLGGGTEAQANELRDRCA